MFKKLSFGFLAAASLVFLMFILVPNMAINSYAQTISKAEASRLTTFLKRRFAANLPPGSEITVSGLEKTGVAGFKKGTFSIQTPRGSGQVQFLLSRDGKYMVIGDVSNTADFKQSPIKGLKQGKILVGRQPFSVLITDDGKHLIAGDLIDTTVNPIKQTRDKISLKDVPVKGNKNAKVTVVEYSDFQCPFCRRASEILPKLLDEYGNKISVVYKQFPLPNHNWAKPAAIAALCAFDQGNNNFWKFHDLLFGNQQQINVGNVNAKLKGFASKIGLNQKKFNACLSSPKIEAKIQQETREATSVGVNSTPTFFVNGLMVKGADYKGLKSAVESALKGDL